MTMAKDDPTTTSPPRPAIDRKDIEAKLRELQGEVEVIGEEARSYGIMVGVAAVVAVVAVAFVLGRRRGRRNRTIVEVRRI
jgi:hypothetical protein